VERDGEAVRLVTDPLEQLQPRIVAVEHDRLGSSGHEDVLVTLRQRDHGDARQVVRRVDRVERGGELSAAAVDDDEVRDRAEALVPRVGRRRLAQPCEPS
jgi:hypothetical protein